jgi:hypothetical protein
MHSQSMKCRGDTETNEKEAGTEAEQDAPGRRCSQNHPSRLHRSSSTRSSWPVKTKTKPERGNESCPGRCRPRIREESMSRHQTRLDMHMKSHWRPRNFRSHFGRLQAAERERETEGGSGNAWGADRPGKGGSGEGSHVISQPASQPA